ncbi:MAG: uncharacterized protein KVP18_004995 [Porospora cf. gigantea A]|uniref:uncharacterized protein n=1 Tax=Porospora cf. gigantea A TaxID=2853593 RepID=UPI00355AC14D|nr:MAG: hypothetical protein KVP18_004995 [Porospora cf. gigantea A]
MTYQQRNQRLLSSSVIGEEYLGDFQEEQIRYVEVPVVEEVIRHVPRKEIIEVEKRIPKYEVEYVEKIVNVPHVQIVDKHVEVPQVQEVVRHVPKREVIEVQKQVIKHVPKVETRFVEKIVEVPGEVIEVPKPYLVEQKVIVPRYVDREVPTVVAQKLIPIVSESETDFIDVELREYNPRLVPVDLFVPRPVNRSLIASGKKDTHKVVDVPPAQFNALVKQINPSIRDDKALEDLLVRVNGQYPVGMAGDIVTPLGEEWREGHVEGTLHYSHDAPTGPPATHQSGITTSPAAHAKQYSAYSHSKYGSTTVSGGFAGSPQIFTGSPQYQTSSHYANNIPGLSVSPQSVGSVSHYQKHTSQQHTTQQMSQQMMSQQMMGQQMGQQATYQGRSPTRQGPSVPVRAFPISGVAESRFEVDE